MIRGVPAFAAVVALFLCLCMPAGTTVSARAQRARLNVYPGSIVTGPDGTLWFTESRGIERLTTSGKFRLFGGPGLGGSSLAIDKTGQVWFTSGQRIGRIDAHGRINLFPVPKSQGYPTVFTDPHGQLWRMLLLEPGDITHAAFAHITPEGTMTPIFTLKAATLSGLTVAHDGRFWFTETRITDPTQGSGPMNAGWILPDGRSTRFPLPRTVPNLCGPKDCLLASDITTSSDGALWFGYFGPAIGRVTGKGHVDLYSLPSTTVAPTSMVQGPDGNIWLGTVGFGIDRIDRTGQVTFFPVSSRLDIYGGFVDGGLASSGLTVGRDRALWFTMACQNSIGRISLSGQVTRFQIPGTATDAGSGCPSLP